MKSLLPLIFFFFSVNAFAQTEAFEQQYVILNTGEERSLWISMDEQADLLYIKENKEDEPFVLEAADVKTFSYAGFRYYTVPLSDSYTTFLKVLHEGDEFAVLEKEPNYKMIRAIAEVSQIWALSRNSTEDEFYLSYRLSFPGTGAPGSADLSTAVGRREFKVERLVFLAIEGNFKLYYMETDERTNIFDNGKGVRPKDKMIEIMLDSFIKDTRKLLAVQHKARREKLDIRDPYELAEALEAVYQ
ncbi:hypothetical protein [Cesiribacter sp. SM1]|uniref:hypothetical protein n=1 Tax=Cesiribacter sp. SM1 TaxID=2861196 RepID=UPI001CD3D928|nr:hypothetical protein [Cesiribacter sp. SM1]